MKKIKYLVMDVDGTLTDGKIYMGQDGEAIKAFNIKDGCGIKEILPQNDIIPVIITARKSQILENRCREIGISEIYQGVRQKIQKLVDIVKGDLTSVAYIGDDIPDISCMEEVKKAGGAVFCPSDAIPEIKALADYISGYKAGDGAIRDCINYMVQSKASDVKKRINNAIRFILSGNFNNISMGTLSDGSKYTIQEYTTKSESDCILETHRKHIDVQYMIEGHEGFNTYMVNGLTSTGEYNSETDTEYWQDGFVSSHNVLVPGSLIVIYNGQPHKEAIQIERTERIRKLVCKIEI